MTYKDSLIAAMDELATDPKRVFVGYNVRYGSKANGTLIHVNDSQLIETPVAENLMAGMAVGLSLGGFKPVVYIERFDFILNAMDAIVNHLDKLDKLSNGQFKPTALIRVVIGSKKSPLFTGPTHTQDFTEAMRHLVSFPVYNAFNVSPLDCYRQAAELKTSCLVIEYRDFYAQLCS